MIIRSLIFIFFFSSNLWAKDIYEAMDDALDNMGYDTKNVTGDVNFRGQKAGHFTLGNVFARSRVVNTPLSSLRTPSLRAGCGGIDLYAGGFSFINEDQFVALGKAIAANASGFAFKMALQTICPSCEATMKDLQQLAQRINNLNINSCDVAKGLMGTAASKFAKSSQAYCETIGNSSGAFTDYAKAKAECSTGGKAASILNSASREERNGGAGPRNMTWEILQANGAVSAANLAENELLMSMVGTHIVRIATNGSIENVFISPLIDDSQTVETILKGGTNISVLACQDKILCLNPVLKTKTIESGKAYQGVVSGYVNSIADKIRSEKLGGGASLTESEKAFLQNTNLPILRIIETYAGYSHLLGPRLDLEGTSEYIALNISYKFLSELIHAVEQRLGISVASTMEERDKFLRNLVRLSRLIDQKRQESSKAMLETMEIVERIKKVELGLKNKFNKYQQY
jgi:conjugative transfer pilus assembly protein TraH